MMSSSEILQHVELNKDMSKMHEEGWSSPLGGDIKKNWVKNPLRVWHEDGRARLADGHHRLAVAHSIDPTRPIPVEHQYRR